MLRIYSLQQWFNLWDPLIQFREAYRWVDQAGARFVADAGCGYGSFSVFVARQAPTLSVDGYTPSDVQRAVCSASIAAPASVEITSVVAEL
jgi:tRNA/tmRNA/rRNA uracil-C5-methylase (TrmA/RlmC/RlmD family)